MAIEVNPLRSPILFLLVGILLLVFLGRLVDGVDRVLVSDGLLSLVVGRLIGVVV